MKNAISLLELIFSLFIGSIILIYTFKFSKEIYTTQNQKEKIAILKIDMSSTKIFIDKNIKSYQKISYGGETLFFDNNILLTNVKEFQMIKSNNLLKINISLDNKISQQWVFKL